MASPQIMTLQLQQTLHMYLLVTTLLIYNGSSGTGLYMEINGAYMSVLPPAVNFNGNPACGRHDYDYIIIAQLYSHFIYTLYCIVYIIIMYCFLI